MKRLHSLIRSSAISLLEVAITHCQAIKLGAIVDVYTTNNIMNGYTKCRELCLAQELFNEMFHRDIVSWNTIITGYINSGDLEIAWAMLKTMKRGGYEFNGHTFGSMLKGVASSRELELGQQIHSMIFKMGFSENVFSCSALLDMYAKCGRVEDAYVVFQCMPEPNYISWNALIAGYAQVGDHSMAFWLLKCMEQEGVNIDDGTISPLLTLLNDSEFYGLAMQLHCKIVKHGLESDNTVCNASITAYSVCGSLQDAKRVFDCAVGSRDLVTWNSMLAAYLLHDREDLAFKIFIDMQILGFKPDIYTYTSIISACSLQVHKCQGKSLHGLVIKRGLENSVPVSNALIAMYLRLNGRCMKDALKIFISMESKDCVTWNSILTGYSQVGLSEDALRLFVQMRSLVTEIDHYTFSAVIRSCSDLATLQLGQQFHILALKVGFGSNVYVGSSLIFMYSKCGIIEDARKSFEATCKDNAIVWNSIIFGYAQHGQGTVALDLFYLMRDRKVKPDHITFVAVLTACSHNGLVEEGSKFLESMESDFGIAPLMEHYTCAIDLYGRAGHLEKAKALVQTMPFEPDTMVWKTLLGACRTFGDIELASKVASFLLELEPEEHCTYVLLSDMYSRLKMWDEKASITRLMRERRVKKVPGWSWIEVKNEVHAFNAEDHSHPQCKEIYLLLRGLMEEIKMLGTSKDGMHLFLSQDANESFIVKETYSKRCEVRLLGFWSSPYVHRVIWALKLKGISYEYIEQDRFNKSELLLQSNPVYKKVPVLIHGDRAITESPVILEYIEETWPDIPLLPKDAYHRALARFWIKFSEDTIKSVTAPFFQTFKDEREKADTTKKALETLQVLEEQGLGDKKFFGGNNIGMVDISYGALGLWLRGLEEIVGIKLIEPTSLPRLHAWVQRFKETPVIKENLPNYEKLLVHLRWRREGIMSGSPYP